MREAPVGIALLDIPDYRYALINHAYEALSGKGWLQGLTLTEVWGEEADQFSRLLDEVIRDD